MSITLYGIPNCDTVKKARAWLSTRGVDYSFHDYRKAGIDTLTLQNWCRTVGYQSLLNQRGTTWRKLQDADKAGLTEAKAVQLMQAHPALIKRPVVAWGKKLLTGFSESEWESLL